MIETLALVAVTAWLCWDRTRERQAWQAERAALIEQLTGARLTAQTETEVLPRFGDLDEHEWTVEKRRQYVEPN